MPSAKKHLVISGTVLAIAAIALVTALSFVLAEASVTNEAYYTFVETEGYNQNGYSTLREYTLTTQRPQGVENEDYYVLDMSSGSSDYPMWRESDRDTENRVTIASPMAPACTRYLFSEIDVINGLSNLSMENVENASSMFYYYRGAGALDLSSWGADMGNVQDVSAMFCNAPHITELNLSNWDLRSVTSTSNASSMFDLFNDYYESAIETIVLDGWKPGPGIRPSGLSIPEKNGEGDLVSVSFANWDLNDLTDLSGYFSNCDFPELDLSSWDVSQIQVMDSMFEGYGSYEAPGRLDLSGWTVSSLRSAAQFLSVNNCYFTELDFSGWTVPQASATAVKQLVRSALYVSSCPDGDPSRSMNLSEWDISGVTSTDNWFDTRSDDTRSIILNCSRWNAPDLVSAESMFAGMHLVSVDVSGWRVPALKSTGNMFASCNNTSGEGYVSIDISNWSDVAVLEDMSDMFKDCEIGEISVEGWSLAPSAAKVRVDLSGMFSRLYVSELDLSSWASVIVPTSTHNMIGSWEMTSLNLSGFDMRECIDMYGTINAPIEDLTLDDWIVGSSTDMGSFFYPSETSSPVVTSLDLSSWTLDGVTDLASWRFMGTPRMSGYADELPYFNSYHDSRMTPDLASGVPRQKIHHWDDSDLNASWLSNVESLNLSGWDVSEVENFSTLFYGFANLSDLDITGWDMSSAKCTSKMFYGCSSLTSIDIADALDGATLVDTYNMFSSCPLLEEIALRNVTFAANFSPIYDDENNLVTGYQENRLLGQLAYECWGLERIYFDHCTLDDVTSDYYEDHELFRIDGDPQPETPGRAVLYADGLKLNGEVTGLFYQNNLSSVQGIETWDTSELTNAYNLLESVRGVDEIDVSSWDVSKITDATGMFSGLEDTTVINMTGLSWDSIEDVSDMFSDSYKLATIYVSEGTDWYAEALASPTKFHSGQSSVEDLQNIQVFPSSEHYDDEGALVSSSLVGSKGTALATVGDSSLRYARVDGLGDQPGYFTAYVPPTTVGDVQAELDSIEYADVSADGYDIPSDRYWTTSQERAAIDEAVQNTETALSSEPASGELAEFLTALRTAHAAYDAAKKPGLAVSAHIRHEMKTSAAVDAGGIAYAVTAEPITALSPEHIAEGGSPVPASIAPAPITITPAAAAATEGSDEYAKAFETDIIAQAFFGDAALFELPGVYFFALAESHGGGTSDDAAKWSYGGERYMMRVYIENDPASQGRLKYSSISLRTLDAQGGEGADKAAEATFTSSYTGWQTLTVTKKVEGDFANKQLDFDFRVTLYLPSWFDAQARDVGLGNAALSSAPARSGDAGPYAGIYTASLHNDESATFEVPVGTYYKIEEIGAPPDTGIPYDTDIEWAVSL